MATRPLWHDELYTYYIAKSPTLSSFIAAVTHLDLQPPLGYVLSRISMKAFGDSALVTRLPSMIAFAVASLCLYYVVRRRLGRFYGLVAMLVLWLSPFFFFAAKARPYALVLGFLCLANPLAYGRGRSDRPRLQISSLTVFWRDRDLSDIEIYHRPCRVGETEKK